MDVSLYLLAFIAGPAFLGSFASPLEKKQISTDLDYIEDSIRTLTSLLDKLNELKKESDLNIEKNAAPELDQTGKTRASQLRHPGASTLDQLPADKRSGTGAKIGALEVGGTGGYKHEELGVGGTSGYKNGVGGTGGYKNGVGGTGGYKNEVGGTGGYKNGVGGTGGYKNGVGGTGGYKNGVGGTGGYKHEELGVGGTGGYKHDKLDEKKHQLLEVLEELLED